MLVSMVPIVELRGGIPFGVSLGLTHWLVLTAAIIGNLLPVPFILVYIRRLFAWMCTKARWLNRLVAWLERKGMSKSETVYRYQLLGLFVLVAIPLPGTGAWTGTLVAALMDIRLKNALPAIALGVLAAAVIISVLTYGVVFLIS